MSTFKKVISIVLCVAMLVGSVAIVGELATPKASAAEGTSKIDSYASLDAAYDNFIYFGTEVYEIETEDGTLSSDVTSSELTDYYVEPGQLLQVYLYIKSDMYCGNGTFLSVNDNDFFDVTQMTAAAPNSTAEGYYTQGLVGITNSEHPAVYERGAKTTYTSATAYYVNWIKLQTGFDQTTLEGWDITQQTLSYDTSVNTSGVVYLFTSDAWLYSWYAKVKDDVAENATGEMKTVPELWKCGDLGVTVGKSNAKQSNLAFITVAKAEALGYTSDTCLVSKTGSMFANYSDIGAFIYDDMCHTFTCGKNPAAGGTTPEKKYTVTFLENDGSEISAAQYVKGASVTAPEAAENQVGWANASTGKVVDLSTYTVAGDVTFKRVLSTDKFDVTIKLNGGTVDESKLPTDASVDASGNLVVKAAYGETVDLTALPAPEKAGYTAAWNPETVTVDNIKGASASVTWTANKYTVTFYNNKGDETPAATVEVAYNTNASFNKAVGAENEKFAGWIDAETDQIVSTTAGFKYTYTENKSFYANWTEYSSSITFMIRDFENGGWKVGGVKYADESTKLTSTQLTSILNEIAGKDNVTATGAVYSSEEIIFDNKVDASSITYQGQTLYAPTNVNFNITWKVPVYDEDAEAFSGEYTETITKPVIYYSADSTYHATTADTTAPSGYVFKGWIDEATGKYVDYHSTLGITLTYANERDIVLVADFQEAEYTIIFNMNNNAGTKFTMDQTVKMGDAINTDSATYTSSLDGKAAYLPVVGVEGGSQATPVYNRYGYMLTGWKLGTGANAVDITLPVDELTYDMIADYASGLDITIYAQWEAVEYELRFYYATAETDMSKPVTERYTDYFAVKYKTGESFSKTLGEAEQAIVNSKVPEGYTFLMFSAEDASINKMPAYGLNLYARYSTTTIKVYIDYDNGKTDEEGNLLPLEQTLDLAPQLKSATLYYGQDPEARPDLETGAEAGVGFLIQADGVVTANRPGEDYVVVSWNIYHVNAGDSIYDKANWKEGINDDGSNAATTTLIYQPEWKQYGDFFFRVYDTNSKLCKALGKDFKMYYWAGGTRPCERSETQVNRDSENLVILLYTLELEGWNWDNFFSCDMWSKLTLKVEPLFVPKSMFTWEAFVGLMGALGNLIKSLF